ncbi:hypothetical protein Glove_281g59 [Diversispora epigaea]|uniref:Protein kinase domain-containing protein n=1 Tax=Diversispora epigaea TaxID=1348612 RepID=A0A397I276_9GLOM|nr:hypothetical protein Glove_281g59 [Diversispora epigaea]
MSSEEICPECNQENTSWDWCKPCNSKHFRNDFNNWTSGNDKIDKFMLMINVKQIGKGGFGTIHYSRWGDIWKWDIENQQWKRYSNREMEIHLKIWTRGGTIRFYGITQDPETHSYMIVLVYAKE